MNPPADPIPNAPAAAPSHDEIAQCAREVWIECERPEGRDEEMWLEAERRLTSAWWVPDVTVALSETETVFPVGTVANCAPTLASPAATQVSPTASVLVG